MILEISILAGTLNLVYRNEWFHTDSEKALHDGHAPEVYSKLTKAQSSAGILSDGQSYSLESGPYASYRADGKVMLLFSPSILDEIPFSITRKRYGNEAGLQRSLGSSATADVSTAKDGQERIISLLSRKRHFTEGPFDDELSLAFENNLPLGKIEVVLIPKELTGSLEDFKKAKYEKHYEDNGIDKELLDLSLDQEARYLIKQQQRVWSLLAF